MFQLLVKTLISTLYSISIFVLIFFSSGLVGSAKRPIGGTIKSASEEEEEERRRSQRLAERQARQNKSDNAANIVERIALDLDQMDLNEAVEMAANAVASNNQEDGQQFNEEDEDNGGGYQQVPPTEQEEEDETSDEDSDGEQDGDDDDVEDLGDGDGQQAEGQQRRKSKNLEFEEQNMSVVQALASGVEVAASEGGKV